MDTVEIVDTTTQGEEGAAEAQRPSRKQLVQYNKLVFGTTTKEFTESLEASPPLFKQAQEMRRRILKKLKTDRDISPKEASALRSKLKVVEGLMNKHIEEGVVERRRIPGTGRMVKVESEYADTATNRKAGRVGKRKTVVTWEDAEYEEVPITKFRKAKTRRTAAAAPAGEDASGEKPKRGPSPWIESLREAREKMGCGGKFVLALKNLPENPTEEQKFAHEVYTLAAKIMAEKKRAAQAQAQAQEQA